MTSEVVDVEPPRRASGLGYQPALDGVRAVAIILVVLVHYPWGSKHFGDSLPMHGGFLGVDAFFVLSGFLITTLLLHEHASRRSISLRNFYARRALRLLPALTVLLVIISYMYLAKDAGAPKLRGIVSIVFYVANWVQIIHKSALSEGPLGAAGVTWSLAVEEQFYIVWPIVLILLLRLRLRMSTIAIVTAVGIAASAAWRAWLWHRALSRPYRFAISHTAARIASWYRVYYGSDTRADALLVGCLTAILVSWLLPRLGTRFRTWLHLPAVGALVICAVMISRASVFHSSWLPEWGFTVFALCVAVVIVTLVAVPHGFLTRVFALPPLAWLGRRSYAVYLFHEFVFLWADRAHVDLSPQLSFLFQMALILAVAELSFRLVEAPMLRHKRQFSATTPRPSDLQEQHGSE